MKTLTLIFLLLILTFTTAQAQPQPIVKFGLKGGLSISRLDFDYDTEVNNSRVSFTGGGFMLVDPPGIWGIQIELLYVRKGGSGANVYSYGTYPDYETYSTTYEVNYAELPVLGRLNLGSSALHLIGGVAVSYNLSSNISPDISEIQSEYEIFSGEISNWDVGIVWGAGLTLGQMVFDVRYTACFLEVEGYDSYSKYNKTISIMSGITF
jgi:hypothetical protein